MLDILAKIYDESGPLLGVSYSIFGGDPHFVTAVCLRMGSVSAVLRAVEDDDTLAASFGQLLPEPAETLVEASGTAPWRACIGLHLRWAWRLTNQQGYSDGVRLEFAANPDAPSSIIVELIVVASAIQTFVSAPIEANANQSIPLPKDSPC